MVAWAKSGWRRTKHSVVKSPLKVLPASTSEDPQFRARLEREARALAALDHPNIVTLHSLEEDDGVLFLTMEHVKGRSLDQALPAGGLALPDFLELALALTKALAAAHRRGVIHRDLKPANIMLSEEGRAKILDFGLARQIPTVAATEDAETQLALTAEGAIPGTAPYMSPEQLSGQAIDERSDLFALGALLYESLTGRRPFGGSSAAQIASAVLRDEPTPLSEQRSDLPAELDEVLARLLAKDPDRRFQSAGEVLADLERLETTVDRKASTVQPQKGRARRWAAVLLLPLLAALAFFAWRDNDPSPPALERVNDQSGEAAEPDSALDRTSLGQSRSRERGSVRKRSYRRDPHQSCRSSWAGCDLSQHLEPLRCRSMVGSAVARGARCRVCPRRYRALGRQHYVRKSPGHS